jgi:hypothetical protein
MKGENGSTRRKTYTSACLSTTNLTSTDVQFTSGLRGERPATNRQMHGTVAVFRALLSAASARKSEVLPGQGHD